MGRHALDITFGAAVDDEVYIYLDNKAVGSIYKAESVLTPGTHDYLVHLADDYRGWKRVTDRSKLRAETERWIHTHPLWG